MKHNFNVNQEDLEKFLYFGKKLLDKDTILTQKERELENLKIERDDLLKRYNSIISNVLNENCKFITAYREKVRDVKIVNFTSDEVAVSLSSLSIIKVKQIEVYDTISKDCLLNIINQCIETIEEKAKEFQSATNR